MRNCFVPNCDKDSKYDKRMMFLPPKNPELFEKWRIVLPKKRQFKKTDKICSRHFLKEDIITTWDTQIQGKLVQLERDKPRLKDSAIPGLNLSPHNEYKAPDSDYEENVRKTRTAKAKKLATIIRLPLDKQAKRVKRELKPESNRSSTQTIIVHSDTTVTDLEEFVVIAKASNRFHKVTPQNKEEESVSLLNEEDFENLYDSIYEVTLPNTLWGFHRCLDKQFIVITKFDPQSMFAAKVIFIKSNFSYELHLNGQMRKSGVLMAIKGEDITESLNELLSNFDEDKILFDDQDIEIEMLDK